MNRRRIHTIRIAAGLLLLGAVAAAAYDNGDWQVWNTDSTEFPVSRSMKIKAETQFYFGDSASDFYYAHVDAGLAWKAASWFEAGLYQRYIQEKKGTEWFEENRPYLDGIFQGKIGSLTWANRNRFEYREREGAAEGWRYRNRLRLLSAKCWTRLKIQPYADAEPFYDIRTDSWNQNRLSAGLTFKAASFLKIGLYYMAQFNRKNGEWSNVNILGVDTKWTFF